MPDLTEFLFGSAGRLSRRGYVLALAGLGLAGLAVEALETTTGFVPLAVILRFALWFSLVSVIAKRLHDLGRSGWWSTLIAFAIIPVWPTPQSLLELTLAAGVWLGLGLLLLPPGQPGFNRYGKASGQR